MHGHLKPQFNRFLYKCERECYILDFTSTTATTIDIVYNRVCSYLFCVALYMDKVYSELSRCRLEDEWVPEKEVTKIKRVEIAELPVYTKVLLYEQFCATYR